MAWIDLRLYMTLVRFDPVYVVYFKTSQAHCGLSEPLAVRAQVLRYPGNQGDHQHQAHQDALFHVPPRSQHLWHHPAFERTVARARIDVCSEIAPVGTSATQLLSQI